MRIEKDLNRNIITCLSNFQTSVE